MLISHVELMILSTRVETCKVVHPSIQRNTLRHSIYIHYEGNRFDNSVHATLNAKLIQTGKH